MFSRNDFQFCFEHVRWLRLATLAANSWSGVWQSHRSEAKHPARTFRLHCQAEYFCASLLAINLIAFKPDVHFRFICMERGNGAPCGVLLGGGYVIDLMTFAPSLCREWVTDCDSGNYDSRQLCLTFNLGAEDCDFFFRVYAWVDGKRCFYGSTLQSFCWNCSMIHVNLPKNLHHRESAELDRLQCAGAFPGAAVCFSESPVSGGCMAYTMIILWLYSDK